MDYTHACVRPRVATRDGGFTLVEVLVVVIILGIVAAVVTPIMLNQRQKAQDAAVKSTVGNVAQFLGTGVAGDGVLTGGDGTAVGTLTSSKGSIDKAGTTVYVDTASKAWCAAKWSPSGDAYWVASSIKPTPNQSFGTCTSAIGVPKTLDDNLIDNGGFENGFAGWYTSGWMNDPGPGGFSLDSSQTHTGTRSQRMNVGEATLDQYTEATWNAGASIAGRAFTMSAWVKTSGLNPGTFVACNTYWRRADGAWIWANNQVSSQVSGTTDWTRVIATSTAPAEATQATIICGPGPYGSKTPAGNVWIDDARIDFGTAAR